MAILITGAEGFVGRNLVEYFKVRGESILAPTQKELDLRSEGDVARYLRNHPVDRIVHCATTIRQGTTYPPDTCEFNLRMFFNLERHVGDSVKLINLGSGSEYSRPFWHRKIPEDFFDRHIPEDGHSYAKYLISKYIRDKDSPNLISLRIFGIFGKYEDYRYKFISNTIVKHLLGLPIIINQNAVYDYLYVEDFARLIEILMKKKTAQRIFNVTPTQSIELVRIAEIVTQVGGKPAEIRVLNEGLGLECTGDNSALLSEIGGFEFTPYEEAIGSLYEYYRGIQDGLDAQAVAQDAYLDYAKKLKNEYSKK